jgi:hypothetical protein
MNSQRKHGAPVNTDNVSSALETTRRLRLALNVLWDDLPDDMNDTPVREALQTIHDRITQAEATNLRTHWAGRALPHHPAPQPAQPAPAAHHGKDSRSSAHPRGTRHASGAERRRLPRPGIGTSHYTACRQPVL